MPYPLLMRAAEPRDEVDAKEGGVLALLLFSLALVSMTEVMSNVEVHGGKVAAKRAKNSYISFTSRGDVEASQSEMEWVDG